ncbi:MAG: M48 family metallopeptidase [Hyphomicrobiaceae bacterium]
MSRQSAKTSPSVQLLKVEGLPAPVEVRRHPTARRLTLRVSRTSRAVYLTLPRNTCLREADRFVARSLEWVRERLDGVPEPVPFRPGTVLPLRDVAHEIAFIGSRPGSPVVSTHGGAETRPHRIEVTGAAEHAPRRLKDWLVEQATRDLDARVGYHAARLGVRARRLTLRDQKSRWGSCSSSGELSFSWRLILAPPLVLDYVAAHEVAHLAEMNHGPRFWRLVEKTMPNFEEARVWLRLRGMDLYRYGVEN